jgi:hypothetical protein
MGSMSACQLARKWFGASCASNGWLAATQSKQMKLLYILPRRTSAKHPKERFEASQVPTALVPIDGSISPSKSSLMQRPSHSDMSSHFFPPSLVGTTQAGNPLKPTGCIEPPAAPHCSAGGTCNVDGDGSRIEGDESRASQPAKRKKRVGAKKVVKVRTKQAIPFSPTGIKEVESGRAASQTGKPLLDVEHLFSAPQQAS